MVLNESIGIDEHPVKRVKSRGPYEDGITATEYNILL